MPRIISLVPSLTATLKDLGREECVVGRTRYCPAGQDPDPPRVGGTKDPDLEAIVDLAPDAVLCVKEENRREDVDALRDRGLEVAVYDPRRVADAPALAWSLARLVGAERAGRQMARALLTAIRGATRRAASRRRVKTAYLVWRKPYLVAGEETYIGDALRTVGLDPVLPGRYPEASPGELVDAGTRLVLFADEPFPFEKRHVEEFRGALPHGEAQGIVLERCRGDLVGWYPSRTADALEHLEGLHPCRGEDVLE